jgi:hypothetical protein
MAIAVSLLTSGSDGWDTGLDLAFTTASITPGTNCALVLLVAGVEESALATSLLNADHSVVSSGSGPTWTKQANSDSTVAYNVHAAVWTAVIGGSSPGSFTVTVDWRGGAESGAYAYSIHKLTGHDTTTTFGGFAVTEGQAGNGAVTATLSAAPAAGDATIALDMADEAGSFGAAFGSTFGTWTETADGASGSHQVAWNTGYRTGSTSTSVEWSDVNTGSNTFSSGQAAIVVKAAGGGGTDATATPSIVTATLSVPAPTASASKTATATVVTATATVPGPTASAGSSKTAAVVTATVAVLAPSVSAGSTVNVTGTIVTATASVLAPTVSAAAGANVTATIVTATASVPAATAATFAVLYPASISGRKVLDQHGAIFVMPCMSSWGLTTNLSDAEITTAVGEVAANGFKAMVVMVGGGYSVGTGWNVYSTVDHGNLWTGTPWASSLGAGWLAVDHFVDECADNDLVAVLSFAGGNGDTGAGDDWQAVTNTDMRNAGIAIASRYAGDPHIQWHVMFDNDDSVGGTRGQRINALFDGINDTEGAGTRPVRWCEVLNGSTTNEKGWYDPTGATTDTRFSINCIYEYTGDSAVQLEAAYAETSGPIGDCEPLYVGHGYPSGNNAQQYRERNYAVFVEGGCLINFGHEDWWTFGASGVGFTSGDWSDVQASTELVQASYAWSLIDAYCRDATWAPTSSFVTTGEGATDAKAAQGASNTAALAYFPDNRTVAVDTTILAGTANVRLRWYDPTTGTYSTIAASEAQSAGRSVTLPAARGDGTRDHVLVVNLLGDVSVTATVVTATASVLAPTVSAGSTVQVTATVVTATASVPAPTVSVGSRVTASVVTATATAAAPGISAGSTVSVTAAIVTATVSAPAPVAGAGAGVTPAVVTATAATLAITPSRIGQTVTAATVTATCAVLAASLLTGTIFTLTPHLSSRRDNRIIRGSD